MKKQFFAVEKFKFSLGLQFNFFLYFLYDKVHLPIAKARAIGLWWPQIDAYAVFYRQRTAYWFDALANTFHPAAIAAIRIKKRTDNIDLEEVLW